MVRQELLDGPLGGEAHAGTTPAIEAVGLTKRYGALTAVDGVDLDIPEGAIFGFLGPNGSGKTTTIRMLLGLVAPTRGSARILGHDFRRERAAILPRVGAIVESPTFYPYLSGRDNLRQLAWVAGVPLSRIAEVLAVVELTDRAGDKVRTYSLGMKQRLGIAGALLNRPRIIFLDEPTNGLDPQGTVDMRNLILRLGAAGHTVFLSSHQLHEVEQVCSHVAIVHKGRLVVQGAVAELLRGRDTVVVEATPLTTAVQVLAKGLGVHTQAIGPRTLSAALPPARVPEAVQALTDAGVRIFAIVPQQASLEDYFLQVTGTPHLPILPGHAREGGAARWYNKGWPDPGAGRGAVRCGGTRWRRGGQGERMAVVLVIEDEVDFSNLVRRALEAEGHRVVQAFTGPDGLRAAETTPADLVLLDWMLPGMDGLSVCRRLRQTHLTPILMLTARGDEVDRVVGLEVGADEYLVKPVGLRELMARVRAMLRRVEMDSRGGGAGPAAPALPGGPAGAEPPDEPAIVAGDLRLLPAERRVLVGGADVDLTPKEYELLKLMAAHPGRAFSREYLLERVWGYEYDGFDRTVDTHILRLRKKLGPLGDRISTVWGVGYRFARDS